MPHTDREHRWTTKLIHPTRSAPEGFRSLAVPVYRGSTTLFDRASGIADTWDHRAAPYTYGSYGTPTTLELAMRIAELEGGHHSFITATGQLALTVTYLSFLGAGDHVLVPESVYGPSREFADHVLRRYGVAVEYYPPLLGAAIEARIREHTRLIWCESPGSNTLDVQDVPAIAAAARARGVTVALDNTWAAGVFFDAFAHGADVAVQSITKYIGGHSDLLLGSITLRDESHYRRVGDTLNHLGSAVSPDDSALALRGMQTLHVRLKATEASALRVAHWLAARSDVEAVLHPALPSCPGHDTWRRDFTGCSGLFSVVFRQPKTRSDLQAAMDRMRLFRMGYSWGGVASLVMTPGPDAPNTTRYGGRLLRLYIGLEDTEDLIADLEQALTV
jgi:cysteine-S-conjugate beta-lyase